MAHEVEQMFYVSNEENNRFVPWHKLGIAVAEAPNSAEALKLAGLDWEVLSKPVYTDQHIEIPNYKANTRSSDNSILGIVTDRYQIVQNTRAFDFTDSLIGEDVRYETAGSLRNGKTVWLLAKMPQQRILDDKVDPYLCFTNSHDGFGSIRVCMTPIRVVCNNTLNFALNAATRCWSTKHIGDIGSKMEEARYTLQLANTYMGKLAEEADRLSSTKITDEELDKYLKELFPVSEDDSDRKKRNVQDLKDQFMVCYLAPDLIKYLGTAYGFVNAASDFATHTAPSRMTASFQENNFARVLAGHPLIDKAYSLVSAN